MTWLKRHTIVVTYILIFVVAAYGFQTAHDSNRQLARQNRAIIAAAAATKHLLCTQAHKSWDQRQAIILAVTAPSRLSPQLTAALAGPLVVQIRSANERKAAQRVELIRIGGPRPTC